MKLDRAEVREKLIAIIEQFTKAPRENLLHDKFSDAQVDSLSIVEILFQIEEQFEIRIPDERAREIDAFPGLLAVVEELLEAKPGS